MSYGYGLMDVDRFIDLGLMGKARVFCDGVDITDKCCSFNDDEGWAECFVQPLQVDGDAVKREILRGFIKVIV